MIIIYSGEGKGKTSAALGSVIRALGHNKKITLIQVFKTDTTSEAYLLKRLIENKTVPFVNNFNFKTFGTKKLVNPRNIKRQDKAILKKAMISIEEEIEKNPFLLILDEILIALKFQMIDEDQLLHIIKACKDSNIHLILTGRGVTKKIIKAADLVTEMKNVKHPFDLGEKAVRGIDY